MVILSLDPPSRQYLLLKSLSRKTCSRCQGCYWQAGFRWQHFQGWLRLQKISLPKVMPLWEQPTSNGWWGVYINATSFQPIKCRATLIGCFCFQVSPWGWLLVKVIIRPGTQLNLFFCQILFSLPSTGVDLSQSSPQSPLQRTWRMTCNEIFVGTFAPV